MEWFWFALAAGLISALNVWSSKLLVVQGLNPMLVGGAVHLWGALCCIPLWIWISPKIYFSWGLLAGLLVMGLVYTVANGLYFGALEGTPLSEIDLYLRTSAVWTLVLAAFAGGALGGPWQLLGAVAVIASVMLLSTGKVGQFARPQLLALAAAALFGLGNVLDSRLSPAMDAVSYSFVNMLLTAVGMMFWAKATPKDWLTPSLLGWQAWWVGLTFALTLLLLVQAYAAGGGAGQVILVAQVRLLLLVGVGVLVLAERDRLGRKGLSLGLMVVGLLALYS